MNVYYNNKFALTRHRPPKGGATAVFSEELNVKPFIKSLLFAALAAVVIQTPAQAEGIVIAYQTGVDPAKVAQADGAYEKAIGQKLDWRRFNTGPDVVAALASGDVQIGNIGSSPLAAASSRQLPLVAFLVAAQINAAEALVVRNGSGIDSPEQLLGKTIATPFVSTAHYSLLGALKHWKIDPSKLKIVNLNPTEINAAWKRGDIDGAFVWSPALSEIKRTGKVLTDAAEVAQWGAPTFEVWVARKDFAEQHADILERFAGVTLEAYADYQAHAAQWTADSAQAVKIAKLVGTEAADIPELLAGYHYPSAQDQLSDALLGGGVAKDIASTAAFLKEQKRIPSVLPDYSSYVSSQYVRQAQ
jgi:taurine transport system substrate-binding protein